MSTYIPNFLYLSFSPDLWRPGGRIAAFRSLYNLPLRDIQRRSRVDTSYWPSTNLVVEMINEPAGLGTPWRPTTVDQTTEP